MRVRRSERKPHLAPRVGPILLDVVVTPWFVDIVHQDLKVTANHINQLLKPGGLWINYGSLAFFHADETKCYAREEVPEVIKLEGFGDVTTRADQHSYLDSRGAS